MIKETDILRFLEGTTTEDEAKELELWINQSKENFDHFTDIKLIWSASSTMKDYQTSDVDTEWNQFNKLIAEEAQSAQIDNAVEVASKSRKFNFLPYSIAASFALILAAFFYSQYQTTPEVITSLTQVVTTEEDTKEVTLPDNSIIQLDARSSLEYSTTIDSDAVRQVSLKEGSAVFDVAHDADRKFVVLYDGIAIEVLGTVFELGKSNDQINISLKSGSIKAYQLSNKNNSVIMKPGDEIFFADQSFVNKIEPIKKANPVSIEKPSITPETPAPITAEPPTEIKKEVEIPEIVEEKVEGSDFRIKDVLDLLKTRYGKQIKIDRRLGIDKEEFIKIDVNQPDLKLLLKNLEETTTLKAVPGKCDDCYRITAGSKK